MTEASGEVAEPDVADLIAALVAGGATVATAESVTGGRVVAALTSVAGSSAVVRGAVVAYSSDVKVSLLGVDPKVLARLGPVCPEVADQMARGARERLGATFGISTTGEAGPESASGRAVGTVFIAVAGPQGTTTHQLHLDGTRDQVQTGAVVGALRILAGVAGGGPSAADRRNGAGSGNNGG